MLRRLIGENIILEATLDPNGAHVKADPGLMVQLLMNLAVNARDAMPQGGHLAIRTATAGKHVWLEVTDSGVGMAEDTKRRVFEPFFTTKPVGEGTGIGLATVKSIVEQTGGTIEVESQLGCGTTFRICLPLCLERDPAKATTMARRSDLRASQTILLVEDEDMVRTLAQRILEAKGYRVFAAPCGDDALALFEQIPGRVDLVVTDVVMPGLSGRQVAEKLRERKPELKVLFM